MSSENSSYKSIIKSTAVFGGAQLVQMLIVILRSKFIAIFLGSTGMGVNAIFQSTIAVIASFSSFGIFQSAVRDISQAHESKDEQKLATTNVVFSRIVLLSGCFGMLICLIGSPWLSEIAFQNSTYSWHFALLSLSLIFTALSNGNTTFLQGTRNLAYLAKASMLGAALSLGTSLPLFYFFGISGIMLSILFSSIIIYLTQLYYLRKIKLITIGKVTLEQTLTSGLPILKLGSVLMLSTVTITIFTYITNIYIGRYGKIEDVGFFQGVSSITMQSIAIVIAILASDFFPRLSAIHLDSKKVKILVNQQVELVSLIIAPIVVILIVFAPLVIKVLLSENFLIVVPMLRWMALSLLFRGIWLIMSYIILAKGDKKTYFLYDAIFGNGLLFIFNIIAYSKWGLQGLAISFLAGSIIVAMILIIVVKLKYNFNFNIHFLKIFLVLFSIVVASFLNMQFLQGWWQYGLSLLFIMMIFMYAFQILNNRLGILEVIKSKLK